MRTSTKRRGFLSVAVAFALVAAACGGDDGGGGEPLDAPEAAERLADLLDDVDWRDDTETQFQPVEEIVEADLARTLPPIDEFPVVVRASAGSNQVVAEIFASTEKSGEGSDGWIVEAAEAFNDVGQALADGRTAQVEIRRIASGTGYQFIAAGQDVPDGFSPSNQLWVEMASAHGVTTQCVSDQLVPNVAGIVMKTETADRLRAAYPSLDAAALIEAVIAGDVVMGYTDPFASSTGLNFLITVLDSFAGGDEARLLSPDVASVFEQFQQRVPFVALTTLQIRESVENESGTLDAFVMEWQTFEQTDSLRSGFEFIPFGVRHDNPLCAVGDVGPEIVETLELFATFTEGQEFSDLASEYGFDPPAYDSDVIVPSGQTLIDAQQLWKERKDGGRPVSAVFVTDVSGSMLGDRIAAVKVALQSAQEFITPEASIGIVEFDDETRLRLPIAPFDLTQQGKFLQVVGEMDPNRGTAMYDGIVLGLSMLLEEQVSDPDAKLLLFVLTDGETVSGHKFGDVERVIQGLGIPIFTVGFEADVDELARLSALVEAASINASQSDVEFKIASLFNAGV